MSMATSGMAASRYLAADGGGHRFVRLELDDEVHAFADEVLGVAQRDLRLVAVVDDDQLRPFPLRRPLQAGPDFARERGVLALRAVAQPIPLAALDGRDQAGSGSRPTFSSSAAVVERVEEAEAHALAEARALDDVTQAQRFARRLEGVEDAGRVHDRAARCTARVPAWA
jgi:hypothetical protein